MNIKKVINDLKKSAMDNPKTTATGILPLIALICEVFNIPMSEDIQIGILSITTIVLSFFAKDGDK